VRRYAGPGALFLFGLGWQVIGLESAWLGIALMGVGAAWGLVAVPPVAGRLPAFTLKRPVGELFVLDVSPRERSGRKRLKRETEALARDIHEYVKQQPSRVASSIADHHEMVQAMQAAETEAEENRIWEEHSRALTEAHE
jgi:hypothetical protein